jgi:hypothetical protein
VQKWADANASAMGLTSTQAIGLAANMQDLLVPLGFARDQAADMSTKTIGLAGALAEWSGGTKTSAEVADILTKAMLGETDGLKSLGISISAADIAAQMAADGTAELTGEALAQAKAMAVQELIFNKSTDAQEAFANGAGSAARNQAVLNASLETVKETIATAVFPVIQAITGWLAENLPIAIGLVQQAFTNLQPIIDMLGQVFGAVFGTIGEIVNSFVAMFQANTATVSDEGNSIMDIINSIGIIFGEIFKYIQKVVSQAVSLITGIWNTFGKDIMNTIKKYLGMVGDIFKNALKVIEGVFDIFAGIFSGDWSKVWEGVQKVVGGIFDGIKSIVSTGLDFVKSLVEGAFKGIISFLGGVGGKIANAAKGMWDGIWAAFKAVINTLIRGWNSLKFTMPTIDLGPLGQVGGFTIGTPNIPYLHSGGIVPGLPGSDQLAILQAGEMVVPRKYAGGAGTVNIYISEGAFMDGPSVDRLANIITKRMRYATGI